MNVFIVTNTFTGYRAEIKTRHDRPSVKTIEKHFRKAKAKECKSKTCVFSDGIEYLLCDLNGKQLIAC